VLINSLLERLLGMEAVVEHITHVTYFRF